MQLGKATLIEVNEERNTCKNVFQLVLCHFGFSRDKGETMQLRSKVEALTKDCAEFKERVHSSALENQTLKQQLRAATTHKMYLTVGIVLNLMFHHTGPAFFVSLTLLYVVYGGGVLQFAERIREYLGRHAPEALRSLRENVRVKVRFWHERWRVSRIRGWRSLWNPSNGTSTLSSRIPEVRA